MFGWEWKRGGMEKINLYKFTHLPLLKNDVQLNQKSDKQLKKINHLNLLKKIKSMSRRKKKITSKKTHTQKKAK